MNTAPSHIPEDDLALFALALLPPDEAAVVQAHLQTCEPCRSEVARLQGDLAGYAYGAEMQDPSPRARARLLDAVARERRLQTPERPPVLGLLTPRPPRGFGGSGKLGWFSWTGWAVAACALAVAGWEFQQQGHLRSQLGEELAGLRTEVAAGQQTATAAQQAAAAEQEAAANAQRAADEARRTAAAEHGSATEAQQAAANAKRLAEEAQQAAAAEHGNATDAQRTAAQAREAAAAAQVAANRGAQAERVLQLLTDPAATQVALHPATAPAAPPQPEGHASYDAGKGELVFVATHLQPVQPGKTYELWVLPASGAAPVAAGLFRPDANGNASVILPNIPKNVPAKGFGITVEPDGGSSGPTLPIVLAGA